MLDVGSAVVIACACLAFRPKSRYLTACDKCSSALFFVPQVMEPSEGGGQGMGTGVLVCVMYIVFVRVKVSDPVLLCP